MKKPSDALFVALLLVCLCRTECFTLLRQQTASAVAVAPTSRNGPYRDRHPTTLFAEVSVTQPSPDDAAAMGIREWPQQSKSGAWRESCSDGQSLTRYILDGTGSLSVDDGDAQRVAPGTLVEVTGAAELSWQSNDEMIILTPSFEEGGKLAAVVFGLILVSVALIAGVGSS